MVSCGSVGCAVSSTGCGVASLPQPCCSALHAHIALHTSVSLHNASPTLHPLQLQGRRGAAPLGQGWDLSHLPKKKAEILPKCNTSPLQACTVPNPTSSPCSIWDALWGTAQGGLH